MESGKRGKHTAVRMLREAKLKVTARNLANLNENGIYCQTPHLDADLSRLPRALQTYWQTTTSTAACTHRARCSIWAAECNSGRTAPTATSGGCMHIRTTRIAPGVLARRSISANTHSDHCWGSGWYPTVDKPSDHWL